MNESTNEWVSEWMKGTCCLNSTRQCCLCAHPANCLLPNQVHVPECCMCKSVSPVLYSLLSPGHWLESGWSNGHLWLDLLLWMQHVYHDYWKKPSYILTACCRLMKSNGGTLTEKSSHQTVKSTKTSTDSPPDVMRKYQYHLQHISWQHQLPTSCTQCVMDLSPRLNCVAANAVNLPRWQSDISETLLVDITAKLTFFPRTCTTWSSRPSDMYMYNHMYNHT